MRFYSLKNDTIDLYNITKKAFNVYVNSPDEFKTVFGNKELTDYFTFLRSIEKKKGDKQTIELLDRVLLQ